MIFFGNFGFKRILRKSMQRFGMRKEFKLLFRKKIILFFYGDREFCAGRGKISKNCMSHILTLRYPGIYKLDCT